MCPDGHEGVAGGHTSCAFARNVHDGYEHLGNHFDAHSPTTEQWYTVVCDGTAHPTHFVDGSVVNSVLCYAGDNAEVVVW